MKVLIYPHDLGMGGSQLNAIELAARVRDLGAETMIFGRPGVLCERIRHMFWAEIESSDPPGRPSIRIARELRTSPRGPKNYHCRAPSPTFTGVLCSGCRGGRVHFRRLLCPA